MFHFSMVKILILTICFILSQSTGITPTSSAVLKKNNGEIISHKADFVTNNNLLKDKITVEDYFTDNDLPEVIMNEDALKRSPISYSSADNGGFTTITKNNANGKNTIITENNPITLGVGKIEQILGPEKFQNLVSNDLSYKLYDIKNRMKGKNLNQIDFDVSFNDLGEKVVKIIKPTNLNGAINDVLNDKNSQLLNQKLIIEEKVKNQIPNLRSGLEEFRDNIFYNKLNDDILREKLTQGITMLQNSKITHAKLPENVYQKIKNMKFSPIVKENIPIIKSNIQGYATDLNILLQSKDDQIRLYNRLQELGNVENAKREFNYRKLLAKQLLSKHDATIRKGVEDLNMYLKTNFPNKELYYQMALDKLKDTKLPNFDSSRKYYYDQISKRESLKKYNELYKTEYEYIKNNLKDSFPEIKYNVNNFISGKNKLTISEADKLRLKENLQHIKKMKDVYLENNMEKILSNEKLLNAYAAFYNKINEFATPDFDFYDTISRINNKIPFYIENVKLFGFYDSNGLDINEKWHQLKKFNRPKFHYDDGVLPNKVVDKNDEIMENKRYKDLFSIMPKLGSIDIIPENVIIPPVMENPQLKFIGDKFPEISDPSLLPVSDFHDDLAELDLLQDVQKNKKKMGWDKNNLFEEKHLSGTKHSFNEKPLPLELELLLNAIEVPEEMSFMHNNKKPMGKFDKNKSINKVIKDKELLGHGDLLISDYHDTILNDNKFIHYSVPSHYILDNKIGMYDPTKGLLNKSHKQFLNEPKFDTKSLPIKDSYDILEQKPICGSNKLNTENLISILSTDYSTLKQNFYNFKGNLKDTYNYNFSKQKLLELKDDIKKALYDILFEIKNYIKDEYNYKLVKHKMDEFKNRIKKVLQDLSLKKKILKLKDDINEAYNYVSPKRSISEMKNNIKDGYNYKSVIPEINKFKKRINKVAQDLSLKQKLLELKGDIKEAYSYISPKNSLLEMKNVIKDGYNYKSAKHEMNKLKKKIKKVTQDLSLNQKLLELENSLGGSYDYTSAKHNLDELKKSLKDLSHGLFLKQKLVELENTYNYWSVKHKLNNLKESMKDASNGLASKRKMIEIRNKLKYRYVYSFAKQNLELLKHNLKDASNFNSSKLNLKNTKDSLKAAATAHSVGDSEQNRAGEARDYSASKLDFGNIKENIKDSLDNNLSSERSKEYLSYPNAQQIKEIAKAPEENNEKGNGDKKYKYVITTRRKKNRRKPDELSQISKKNPKEGESSE